MSLTISLSGMDTATETALRAAFVAANTRLGGQYTLALEAQSEHVIVDMDSMYGPMSWLRLHAAGKQVVGLTSAPRVQTHYRLGRPFDDTAVVALLREIADALGITLEERDADTAPAGGEPQRPVTADAATVSTTGATAQTDAIPDVTASQETSPTDTMPSPSAVDQAAVAHDLPNPGTSTPGAVEAAAPTTVVPAQRSLVETPDNHRESLPAEPPSAPDDLPATILQAGPGQPPGRDLAFADWLAPGVLQGRFRYRRASGPTLLLDADAQLYVGPSTLKPLSQYFDGVVQRDDFEPLDDAAWDRESASAGSAQPMLRLRWLAGLLAGDGSLLPGYDPDARYVLGKWPQTEREYPRHFRIATAMMKGPATLNDIIAASALSAEEVTRFVNANLATGYAESAVEAVPEPIEAQKPGGFFSRLRRR